MTNTLATRIRSAAPVHLLRDAGMADELALRWSERQRVWHGPGHLLELLAHFEREPDAEARAVLLLAAVYHDAVYDPLRADNEEASAALLLAHAADSEHPVVRRAADIVVASKWSEPPEDALTWMFWEADCRPLAADYPPAERLAYERAVFREYQFASWPVYREKRAEFLRTWAKRFPKQQAGVSDCLGLLAGLAPRVAMYPGSFNPFHRGHLSILRQAERIFDKVIVGVAVNRQKPGADAALTEKRAELQARLRFHEVVEIPGLLTDFISAHPLPLTVVRGVRDGTDLEAELRFARFLDELRPGTHVAWLGCEADLQHLSSSAIRELNAIEPSAGTRYVPETAEIYALSQQPNASQK